MLSLDDPGWRQLRHAYGEADDVPGMLRVLTLSPGPQADASAEPWHSLWSSLYHQGDVYSAFYAALPHIVKIACEDRMDAILWGESKLSAGDESAKASSRQRTKKQINQLV